MSRYKFTREDQSKGGAKAIAIRREKAEARRAKVAVMRAEYPPRSKSEIARILGVNWETINRDCKIIERQATAERETKTENQR